MFYKRKRMKDMPKDNIKQEENFNDINLEEDLDKNVSVFRSIFKDDDTIIFRWFENQHNNLIKLCIIFVDGMINSEIVNENIIRPIVSSNTLKSDKTIVDRLCNKIIVSNNVEKTRSLSKLVSSIVNGDTVLLTEGSKDALIISSKGWQTRSIEEPETEKTLRGPREGFTESLLINLSLLRRKLKTSDLKFKYRTIGVRSNTKVCICYIQGIANEKILQELYRRLDAINIDGLLDSGYIQEIIRDRPFSLFKTLGSTERPDTVAGKLLEGRIAILVDGTPVALTLPSLFIEYFQVSDDYYVNFYFSSIGRLLRIFGFLITISLPAIYVALITYHPEMIPTSLIMNISAAREGVPFPTIVEAIGMLFVFELLRETGLRMPTFMGQALSIVGALVIGQAAVDAKFISAPMIIIIALTGITGLMLPRIKGAVIIIRLLFLFLASFLGLYGYVLGMAGLLIHLLEINAFGIPYMYKLMQIDPLEELKDTAIRAPWWYMKYRQRLLSSNILRNKTDRRNM